MTSVFFDPAVGGDGTTVSDDANPVTGLDGGGHVVRFVPALGNQVNIAKVTVDAAGAAVNAAVGAINASDYTATSGSSVLIGTGAKTFVVPAGKQWFVGQWLTATNSVGAYVTGQVSSYSGTSLVLSVTGFEGAGTFSSWRIELGAIGVGALATAGAAQAAAASAVSTANSAASQAASAVAAASSATSTANAAAAQAGSAATSASVAINAANGASVLAAGAEANAAAASATSAAAVTTANTALSASSAATAVANAAQAEAELVTEVVAVSAASSGGRLLDWNIWKASTKRVAGAPTGWGAPPINILGDSISHGAFAGDLYQDGWARIFTRMMHAELGTYSYGFTPLLTLGSGPTLSKDIHTITFNNNGGSWDAKESTSGGGHVVQGLSFTNTVSGAYIETTLPTFQEKCRIWYVAGPGRGSFEVFVNGVSVGTTNTANASIDATKNIAVAMTDNGKGACTIRVVALAAGIELAGFSYTTGDTSSLVVNNFSQSGRRFRYADEAVIESCIAGASAFILALGINDASDCDTDSAYYAAFKQRIDWVIGYANTHKTKVVIPDFCWTFPETNRARQELLRCARECNGTYIPFPDYLKSDGSIANSAYLIGTLNMWVDGSHANVEGNRMIAETIAKALGLSCTSKYLALSHHDYWMPYQIPAGTALVNQFTSYQYLSAYRANGGNVQHRLLVKRDVAGAIPVGDYPVQTAYRAGSGLLGSSSAWGLGEMNSSTGAPYYYFSVGLTGSVSMRAVASYVNATQGAITQPRDLTAI